MQKTYVLRLCLSFMLVVTGLFSTVSPVSAQAPGIQTVETEVTPKPSMPVKKIDPAQVGTRVEKPGHSATPLRSVFYLQGSREDIALAVGLGIRLVDALDDPSLSLSSRFEVVEAAAKGNIRRDNDLILRRDLPYLCLKLDAPKALLGWLERQDDRLIVDLRVYNGVTAHFENSLHLDLRMNDPVKATAEIAAGIQRVLNRPEKVDATALPADLTFHDLVMLGQGWMEMSHRTSLTEGLRILLDARRLEAPFGGIQGKMMKAAIRERMESGEDDLSPLDKAMAADLFGKTDEAAALYAEIDAPPAQVFRARLNLARLHLQARRLSQARQALAEAQRYDTDNPQLLALAGDVEAALGNRSQAAEKWSAAINHGATDPALHEALAQHEIKAGRPNRAGGHELIAGEWYEKRLNFTASIRAFLNAAEHGKWEQAVDRLDLDRLTNEQRAELEELQKRIPAQTERSVLLLDARRAMQEKRWDEAADLIGQAADAGRAHLLTNLMAGEFFSERRPDIDKAILYLERAVKSDPRNRLAQLALGRIYQKANYCDKTSETIEAIDRQSIKSPRLELDVAALQTACRFYDAAADRLGRLLTNYPDYAPAWEEQAKLFAKKGDKAEEGRALERLKAIDAKAVERLVKAKPQPKPGESTSAKKAEPPKLSTIDVLFPTTRNLVKAVPTTLKRVALFDRHQVETSALSGLSDLMFNPVSFDSSSIHKDLAALIRTHATVLDDPDLSDLVRIYPGQHPFLPDSFKRLVKNHDLDGVVLYDLHANTKNPDQDAVDVDLYCFVKDRGEVLHAKDTITFRVEELMGFNFGLILLPLLLIIGLGAAVFFYLRIGRGRVSIRFNYDRTFEEGYFAVRLSSKPLEQPFNIEKLMKLPWLGNRADTEKKIRKFFKSSSRMIGLAERNQILLTGIPTGRHHVHVVGIMVNLDTSKPIGSHELIRRVRVEKDKTAELEVSLETNEAYVEVRIVETVMQVETVKEKDGDDEREVTREVQKMVEVGGATVEVNDDPAFTKVSILGEPVDYYLPFGMYRVLASYRDLAAVYQLEITDTTPKQIELRLQPKADVEANMPPVPRPILDESSLDAAPLGGQPPIPNVPPHPGAMASGSRSTAPPEPIELADDILDGVTPPVVQRSPSEVPLGMSSSRPVDLEDVFDTHTEDPVDNLFEAEAELGSSASKAQYLAKARQMQQNDRFNDAAELYLRAGEYDRAVEMCQKSGNQALTYKVYGISYLKAGNHREAVEMFKYAEEPLLEADALEGLRLFDEANRRRGAYWEDRGDIGRALAAFEKASAWDKIGELHEHLQNYQQAGEAYYRARRYQDAGECFLNANDVKRAAEAFEMDAQYLKAAELYKRLGSNVKIFNLLEKAGRFCEAAEGYKKFGLLDEAVHACQQVRPDSPDFLKASLIMGKIFIEKNEDQLARSVYHKVVENAQFDQGEIERFYEFGVLIQEQGMVHEAYALFERLQTVKYNYADVNIRVQNLLEQIDRERQEYGTAVPPGTLPPFPGYRSSVSGLAGAYQTPPPGSQTPVSNRYVFDQELGRGAMGIVYKARDTALDREVAYKTVANAIKENPASLKYFLSEAKSLAALNHVNIVTVYDVGQESNNYFITMEFVNGRSLADFVMEKGRLTVNNAVVIALKICAALEYAHNKNVVHRDIKPSNIMISSEGEVKIMDFGLAKIMTEAVQDKTVVRGTPLYMSPEQVEGVGVDHRSDIYSFGVTLFEMATGTLPFTKGDIAYHHLHTPPPAPTRYNPSLPEALERIVLKCLEKDKEKRYQSATDIKKDLAPLRTALLKNQG